MSATSRREPGDVINDCKVHFLDEIYQMEKPGAKPLSAADGPFKRTLEGEKKANITSDSRGSLTRCRHPLVLTMSCITSMCVCVCVLHRQERPGVQALQGRP